MDRNQPRAKASSLQQGSWGLIGLCHKVLQGSMHCKAGAQEAQEKQEKQENQPAPPSESAWCFASGQAMHGISKDRWNIMGK